MRWIDDIIKVINKHPNISPIHREVLIARIERWPDQFELEAARKLYEEKQSQVATVKDEEIPTHKHRSRVHDGFVLCTLNNCMDKIYPIGAAPSINYSELHSFESSKKDEYCVCGNLWDNELHI
jgi:hypothetical protein